LEFENTQIYLSPLGARLERINKRCYSMGGSGSFRAFPAPAGSKEGSACAGNFGMERLKSLSTKPCG